MVIAKNYSPYTMFALFEAGLQRKSTDPKPHATSLRSLHGANHVAPLRGAYSG